MTEFDLSCKNSRLNFIESWFEKRKTLKKVFVNASWLFLERTLRIGIGLFVVALMARYLGPQRYGILSYSQAFVTLFMIFGTFGFDVIVVRELAYHAKFSNELLGSAFLLKIIGALLAMVLALVSVRLLYPAEFVTQMLVAVLAIGTVFKAFDVIDFWFQSQMKNKYSAIVKSVAFLCSSIVIIALIIARASLVAFGIAISLELMIGFLGLWIVYEYTGQGKIVHWRPNLERCLSLLTDCWPLTLSSIFVLINMQLDKAMLQGMVGSVAVGVYSAAVKLTEIWYFVPVILGSTIIPPLAKERKEGGVNYDLKVQKVYNVLAFVSIAFILFVSIFSNQIIHLFYGNQYAFAASILIVHSWSILMVFHVSVRHTAWTVEGYQGLVGIFAFLAMITNALANYFLIPKYGGVGAAYASLISWSCSAVVFPLFSKKARKSVRMLLRSLTFFLPSAWRN